MEAHRARDMDVKRVNPMMQMNVPIQPYQQPYGQSFGQPYYPPIGWQDPAQGAGQMLYPQPPMQPQMPSPWQAQGAAQMSPFTMPAVMPRQPLPQMPTRMPEPVQYQPRHHARDRPQYRHAHTEMRSDTTKTSQQSSLPVKKKYPTKRARKVEEVDYIHICDEYPPIVLDTLGKEAPLSPSSSSSSSESSGTTQEVPRASIPTAKPGFADLPFQFPQYPHLATRAWDDPRLYSRQWMGGNKRDANARYAAFMPTSEPTAWWRGLSAHRRRSARSNNPLIRTHANLASRLLLYENVG
jgi:hypothetical protein